MNCDHDEICYKLIRSCMENKRFFNFIFTESLVKLNKVSRNTDLSFYVIYLVRYFLNLSSNFPFLSHCVSPQILCPTPRLGNLVLHLLSVNHIAFVSLFTECACIPLQIIFGPAAPLSLFLLNFVLMSQCPMCPASTDDI